jgi:hypothetical protein
MELFPGRGREVVEGEEDRNVVGVWRIDKGTQDK